MRQTVEKTSPWFPFGTPQGNGKATVFVFHHAGGAASFFHSWKEHPLTADLDIGLVELPGRGRRFSEPACHTIEEVLVGLVPAIMDAMPRDQPVILFGHSLGALIAFEVALALQAKGLVPTAFVASARRAPQMATPLPWRHSMSDEMLIAELRRLGGTREEVLQSEELLELFLPAIRADFALTETYALNGNARLECPLLCLRGRDDPEVLAKDIDNWSGVAASRFSCEDLPGDHFYLTAPLILTEVLTRVRQKAGLG